MTEYSVEGEGFALMEGFLPADEVVDLINFIEQNIISENRRGGVRNLLTLPRMRSLAESTAMLKVAKSVLGEEAYVVRGILFDKTENANWKVPWHQDVTIAVDQKVEASGYGPWSMKMGVLHVQPPASVLECMISIRLHLDDCPEENGALRVIAGSHTFGKLEERGVQDLAKNSVAVTCEMKSGGALLMRPLLLHASSASNVPGHRRVLHFDYAAIDLPSGMLWAESQA